MTDESISSKNPTPIQRRNTASFLRFFLIAGGMLALFHAYIGIRLLPDLALAHTAQTVGAVILALSWTAMLAGTIARFVVDRQAWSDRLTWVGMLAMGMFSFLFVLTLLRDILLAAMRLVTGPISALFLGQSAVAAIALALLATLVGFLNARRMPRVANVKVPIAGLPDALDGFTIAQISDIHIGPTIKGDFLAGLVTRVNKLGADIIAVTGDLVDGSVAQLAGQTASLSKLSARHGVYFVTGNHEYYSNEPEWTTEIRRLGLRVLTNEHVVVGPDGAKLVVAGVTDYSAGGFDPAQTSDPHAAMAGAPPDAGARILLAHQPRSASAAAAAGFDLQLSGHTHGGQFWPWNFFVRLQQPFTAGLDRLGDLWVYTSRGSGYWGPPLRLGAPSEIGLLRLTKIA